MTESKYKHAFEVIENWNKGDKVQEYRGGGWCRPFHSDVGGYQLGDLNDPNHFRIKPTPRKVPWGPEDFKPGMAIKLGKDNPAWGMVLAVQGLGDTARVVMTTYYDGEHSLASYKIKDMSFRDDDAHSWFWSMDGKEWSRLEKDEVVK